MRNWGGPLGSWARGEGFAEGTREIRNTGLALLHQGEMVVPQHIAKHLNAEGTGPFQDAVALVRPGNNEALMQDRIQTEFTGGDPNSTINRANQHLDDLNDYNRQQVEMMWQELELLRQILARLTTPQGGPRPDTASNSRPAPPPQYYEWAVRPLNQPNYGGVENTVRG